MLERDRPAARGRRSSSSSTEEEAVERLLGRASEEGRTDDTPEMIRRRMEVYREQTEPLCAYYLARSILVGVDAGGQIGRGLRRDRGRAASACALARADRDRPQVATGDRGDGTGRPGRSRDARAGGGEHPAGDDDRRARQDRRGAHPRSRRCPDVQGLPRLPGVDLRLARPDGRPRHPGALPARGGRRRSRSTSASPSTDSSRDSAYTFAVGEIEPEAQRLLDVCQAALEAGIDEGPAR